MKNDTELMNDFNLKYSNLSISDFIIFMDENKNEGKYEKIFHKIFDFEPDRTGRDVLREMRNALKQFKPINESLIEELASLKLEVEAAYENL